MSESPHDVDLAHGLGTEDDPCFGGMQQASSHIVGASLAAARQVFDGSALHAVNISGGLHHAMANGASGFCIYNDPAIAIAWLLEQGVDRIAYVDIDVHHGDGVQAAFYDDPRVLTISLHESPKTLFPGTGDPSESGGPHALGTSMNVALPPGTGDGGWLRAFNATVPAVIEAFNPDILVSQHGCDSHSDDPLAHLMLSVDGQREAHLTCMIWPIRSVTDAGWPSAAAAIRLSTSCLAPGPTCSPSCAGSRSTRRSRRPTSGASMSSATPAAPRRRLMTDGVTPEYVDWSQRLRPRLVARQVHRGDPARGLPVPRARPGVLTRCLVFPASFKRHAV